MVESLSSFHESNLKFTSQANGSDMFPSISKPPLAAVIAKVSSTQITNEKTSAGSQHTNLNNFQISASYLKDKLLKKGRCPVCTLPIP